MLAKLRILFLLLLPTFSMQAEETSSYRATMVLRNGDLLTGQLGAASEENILFKSYWSEKAFKIPLASIYRYQRLGVPEILSEDGIQVTFKNGGRLRAKSIVLKESIYEVENIWGEWLSIPKSALASIRFFHSDQILYQGPTKDEASSLHEGNTRYLTPKIREWSSTPVDYPDTFLMEMELATDSPSFVYQLQLFNVPNLRSPGRVTLEVTEKNITGSSYVMPSPGRVTVTNWKHPLTGNSTSQSFRLFGNAQSKTFTLYLNNQKIHTWANEAVGTSIGYEPLPIRVNFLSGDKPLALKNFRLLEWNQEAGMLDGLSDSSDQDKLFTSKSPMQTGKLIQLDAEGVFMQMDNGEINKIALKDVWQIHLGGENETTAFELSSEIVLETGVSGDLLPLSALIFDQENLSATVSTGGDSFSIQLPLEQIYRLTFPKRSP